MFASFFSDRTLRPAALSIDTGSATSKACLAFREGGSASSEATVSVLRVPLLLDHDHPEASNKPYTSPYEFVSQASKEGDELVPGRRAQNKTLSWSCKAIAMHVAGVSREALLRMPGGDDLLSACEEELITTEMEEQALLDHYGLICRMARQKAQAASLSIKHVIMTYPNYLGDNERDQDFVRYTSYIVALVQKLWPDDIEFHTTMEGMALALYVCEPFHDGLAACDWQELWQGLAEVREGDYVNLLVVDMGGSTLNLQLLSLRLDSETKETMINCQSNFDPEWHLGAIGGSQLSNTAIKKIIQERLSQMRHDIPSDEFACLMERFEESKWKVDYRSNENKITLCGKDDRFRIRLYPQEFKNAFNCFDHPVSILKDELSRVRNIGRNFAVVFAGGSWGQPGLRSMINDHMESFQEACARNAMLVKHIFLERHDLNWSSAVSVGASVSVMRRPPPVQVLGNSAIALQKLYRSSFRDDDWVGSEKADVLFVQGCGKAATLRRLINPKVADLVKFALVCDPNYILTPESESGLQPIQIGTADEVNNGPLSTYDLGWDVLGKDLPKGHVEMSIYGPDIDALTCPECTGIGPQEQITMFLRCHKMAVSGVEVVDRANKTWKLVLRTDPASKLLVVDSAEVVVNPPFSSRISCEHRRGELFE